jgi:hypothetical protein
MVTTNHPVQKNLNKILRKHIPILHTSERMIEVFKDPPLVAFRPPPPPPPPPSEISRTWWYKQIGKSVAERWLQNLH